MPKTSRNKPVGDPRARILDAALSQFAARGVEGSSIQDVADRARMSKQALMHHFPTKEALRAAVYTLLAERMRSLFPDVAAGLISRSHDRYRDIIDALTRRLDEHQEIARFVAFELLDRPAELMAWLRNETAPWLGLVVGVIEQSAAATAVASEQSNPRRRRAAAAAAESVDAEAHIAVLAMCMLSVSSLVPRTDRKLHQRILDASLQMMRLGSHLDAD